MEDPYGKVFSIGIGGAAGDGVREAGNSLGVLLAELGYEVFVSFAYPSLIRGGHNFARVSFSTEKLYCDHEALDILVSLNEETTELHREELHGDAIILMDPPTSGEVSRAGDKGVPMRTSVENLNAPAIARSSVALGAICYLLDLPLEKMLQILQTVFKDKSLATNVQLAGIGYEHLRAANLRHSKKIEVSDGAKKELVDGNTAFARGLLAAGLELYFAYPMTPATSVLHYLAAQQNHSSLRVVQPESELAVINMALGAIYAGKRAAIGSASGGFALMQEAFSLAGAAGLPLVTLVSQRQAPATGVPTYSSQSDLRFVLHAGHGEFPRLVVAPGDPEEAFGLGQVAFNLAWRYGLPSIVLSDKIISEHAMTCELKAGPNLPAESARVLPGTPGTVVKVTSYEHDEFGLATDDPQTVKKSIDERFARGEALRRELPRRETVKIYGDPKSEVAVVFWGSTKGAVLEAAKYLDKAIKLVQILWLEPFDGEKVAQELSGAKKIINVEANHNGQLAALLREKTGIIPTEMILKYDSRPFSGLELSQKLNNILNRP